MKKVLALILILAVLVPAATLADTPDPIIGSWYYCLDMADAPALEGLEDLTLEINVMTFLDSGDIVNVCIDYEGSKTEVVNTVVGKWEKSGDNYSLKLIAAGTVEAKIADSKLYAAIFNENLYTVFERFNTCDIYSVNVRK